MWSKWVSRSVWVICIYPLVRCIQYLNSDVVSWWCNALTFWKKLCMNQYNICIIMILFPHVPVTGELVCVTEACFGAEHSELFHFPLVTLPGQCSSHFTDKKWIEKLALGHAVGKWWWWWKLSLGLCSRARAFCTHITKPTLVRVPIFLTSPSPSQNNHTFGWMNSLPCLLPA